MDNYNQMMNNDYNNMVYQNAGHQIPMEQQSEAGSDGSILLSEQQKMTSNEYSQAEEQNQQQTMAAGMPINEEQPMEQEYGQQSHQQDTQLQAQDALLIQNHQAQLQQSSVIEQTEEFNSGSGEVLEQGTEGAEEESGEVANNENEEKPETEENVDEKVEGEEKAETVPEQTEGEQEVKIKEEGEESQEQVEGTSEPPKPKEPKIDPQQCRACTSKENLQSIFEYKGTQVIAHLYKMICPQLRITERDALPHMICVACVDKIYMAYEFKQVAENTDKEFRAQLKRSQNKRRAATDYILLDAKVALISSSEDDEDAMMQDDDEFRVSKSEVSESESEDSVDSDFKPKKKYYKKKTPSKKKKKTPAPPKSTGKRGRKAGRPPGTSGKKYKSNVVYIEAMDDDDDADSDVPISKKKKKATGVAAETSQGGLPCPQCDRVLGNSHGLREHLKSHSTEKYTCKLCNKQFKLRLSLDAHMARHREEKERAEQKAKVKIVKIPTPIVKKAVPSKPSIVSSSKSVSSSKKRDGEPTTGKDLFKTCAPLTSTYWSDSFSD